MVNKASQEEANNQKKEIFEGRIVLRLHHIVTNNHNDCLMQYIKRVNSLVAIIKALASFIEVSLAISQYHQNPQPGIEIQQRYIGI